MPSDIRSFFGGKGGGQARPSGQENSVPSDESKVVKSKSRGKRKVVSDSDDEIDDITPKASTPTKAAPRKYVKRTSPVGQIITSSDYFAANGKSKPAHSTPTTSKPLSDKRAKETPSKIQPVKSTPKNETTKALGPSRNSRTSSRRKSKTTYAETADEEDDDSPPIKADEDSGDDIFGAEFKRGRYGGEDGYKRDDKEDDDIKPSRKTVKDTKRTPVVKKEESAVCEYEDFGMNDVDADTEKIIPEAEEKVKAVKSVDRSKAARSRKRKSAELEEDEESDEDDFAPTSKKANGSEAAPTKKPVTKKKEEVAESKAVQKIYDSIPMVRPPTPPLRDVNKKFDFRTAAQHSQPAPAAGSKQVPVGAENCLAGLTFVFTGLLDALGREEGIQLVKRYGGKVTTAPSSKTSFVVLGNDAGPKKLETIAKLGLKTINEDGLFELIRRLPANGGDGKAAEKFEEKKRAEMQKVKDMAAEMENEERRSRGAILARHSSAAGTVVKTGGGSGTGKVDNRLWTVKYAPTAVNMICGNKGQVEKLQTWLRSWHSNARTKFKKAGKDGSGVYRAVIIHGPPGIGKTTAAHLAAKLEGYDVVESNASDTRSKKLVETGLKGVLDTTSLLGYFAGDGKKVVAEKKNLVLIMDEVDGMSAGDRGGVGALAAVCKKTNIPMILICNDRRLPKMKPFDFVTYDLPFRRPTTDQIRARIMTICFREGLKMPTNVVDALIEGSRADIRQIINMISTVKLDQEAMDFDQGKQMSNAWEKHIILKPWDIVNRILGGGLFAPSSTSTLNDKIELYFNDFEMSSLMLQENYLGTNPILSNMYSGKEKSFKLLELADRAAESISDGDLVDRMIHGSQQQWSLMPTHAVFSFVRPASFISGSLAGHGQTRFPSWLGNNSKQGKLTRLVKEIQGHMRLRASGDRHEIRQQYLPLLWYRLVAELQKQGKEGIVDIIGLMDSYFLTKDDWEAMLELGIGPMGMENIKLDTQTKSAFTRLYNQQSHPLPYMKASTIVAPKKVARDKPDLEEAIEASDEEMDAGADAVVDEEEETLDLKKDKYVSAPKRKAAPKKAGAKRVPTKGTRKVKDESDEGLRDDESEEAVEPPKGRGKGKTNGSKGRAKK